MGWVNSRVLSNEGRGLWLSGPPSHLYPVTLLFTHSPINQRQLQNGSTLGQQGTDLSDAPEDSCKS